MVQQSDTVAAGRPAPAAAAAPPDEPLDRAQVEQTQRQRQQQQEDEERERRASEPPYVPQRRVVHVDLKGAPPTVEYLARMFPIISRLGGTDLMIEWEDMFPFSGALRSAAARNHYSRAEVRRILAEARRNGLQVIPLVQTFGHLELFLKLEPFAHLRETPAQPAALCPSRNESHRLVELIVDQVMEMHKDAPYLHIGCDEVYQMGLCRLCQHRLRDELYLEHVARVARYVRRRHAVTPLIWDDMMRHIPAEALRRSGLGQLVEPMVWVYAEDVYRFAGRHVYEAFAEVFPRVWAASAYKGAFGETLVVPPLRRHLDNTLNWLDVMRQEGPKFTDGFRGLVLTGWQRYDHFAVLCELLPAAVPSLAIGLVTASNGFFNSSLRKPLYEALHCRAADDDPFFDLEEDPEGFSFFSFCRFPGVAFYKYVGRYKNMITQTEEFLKTAGESKGWMTEYNVNRNYTNPFRVDEVLEMFYGTKYSLTSAIGSAKAALKGVMDRFTVAEWVEQKIYPYLQRVERLFEQGQALKRRSAWLRRPLPMLQALAQYGLNVTEAEPPTVTRRRRHVRPGGGGQHGT
ncbi:hexosaminidase D-like [Pollicipes pollicipes]|uniref:hexosaminidase D-like n=1 Tax=Pollicipes pollicipes TaxID=41117 RepID=UPI0018856EDA|nr:hexosaminidase D-like [Pollicipes pollicipes]